MRKARSRSESALSCASRRSRAAECNAIVRHHSRAIKVTEARRSENGIHGSSTSHGPHR